MAFKWALRPYWNESRLATVIDRVAARVQNPVWQRVRERVATMSVHEARGYIRARAALIVEREMGILAGEEPALDAVHRDLVARNVRHRVVRRLLFESIRRHDSGQVRRRRLAA